MWVVHFSCETAVCWQARTECWELFGWWSWSKMQEAKLELHRTNHTPMWLLLTKIWGNMLHNLVSTGPVYYMFSTDICSCKTLITVSREGQIFWSKFTSAVQCQVMWRVWFTYWFDLAVRHIGSRVYACNWCQMSQITWCLTRLNMLFCRTTCHYLKMCVQSKSIHIYL